MTQDGQQSLLAAHCHLQIISVIVTNEICGPQSVIQDEIRAAENSAPYFLSHKEATAVKTLNIRRALSTALTGLALAAITQASYAAPDVASETPAAGLTGVQLALAPASADPQRAGRGSPLTLYMEDAGGNAFRLVHVEGTGWRYAEGWKSPNSADASLPRKVAFQSTNSAPLQRGATPDDEPLTVFIDGPSGFTFVWDREGKWKFVGKIADQIP